MRRLIAVIVLFVLVPALLPQSTKGTSAATAKRRSKVSKGKSKSKKSRRPPRQTWRNRQLAPSPERYREIQQALITKGYFEGEATGVWGADSVEALRRFQRDQKLEPTGKIDSLSLIALGLGPKYESPTPSRQYPPPATPPSGSQSPAPSP